MSQSMVRSRCWQCGSGCFWFGFRVRGFVVGVLRWFCFAGAFRFVVCAPIVFVVVALRRSFACFVLFGFRSCVVDSLRCALRCSVVAYVRSLVPLVARGVAFAAFALLALTFVGGGGVACVGARLRFVCLAFALFPLFACVSLGFVLSCVRSFCFFIVCVRR